MQLIKPTFDTIYILAGVPFTESLHLCIKIQVLKNLKTENVGVAIILDLHIWWWLKKEIFLFLFYIL